MDRPPMHRDDVAMYFKICADKFGELGVILALVERDMHEHSDLKKLISVCHYIATDYEDQAAGFRETVEKNGVRND